MSLKKKTLVLIILDGWGHRTDPSHNPTQETLNRLLKPFGLILTIAPIDEKKAA